MTAASQPAPTVARITCCATDQRTRSAAGHGIFFAYFLP
jgi:hypothetical protein